MNKHTPRPTSKRIPLKRTQLRSRLAGLAPLAKNERQEGALCAAIEAFDKYMETGKRDRRRDAEELPTEFTEGVRIALELAELMGRRTMKSAEIREEAVAAEVMGNTDPRYAVNNALTRNRYLFERVGSREYRVNRDGLRSIRRLRKQADS